MASRTEMRGCGEKKGRRGERDSEEGGRGEIDNEGRECEVNAHKRVGSSSFFTSVNSERGFFFFHHTET